MSIGIVRRFTRTKKRFFMLVTLCLVSISLLAPPSQAVEAVASARSQPIACQLATHDIQSIPRKAGGSTAEQKQFVNELVCAIKAAMPGSTIDMSVYALDRTMKVIPEELIEAHKFRGVHVRYTTRDKADQKQLIKLKKELGTKVAPSRTSKSAKIPVSTVKKAPVACNTPKRPRFQLSKGPRVSFATLHSSPVVI